MILSYPQTKAHSFDEGGRREKGAAVAYSQDNDIYHCMTAYYKKQHNYEGHTARRCPDCDIVIDTEWGRHWY